jgi:hypothetical protein
VEKFLANAATLFCDASNANQIYARLLTLKTSLSEVELLKEEWSGLELNFASGQIEMSQKSAHPGNSVTTIKLGIYNFFKSSHDPHLMALVKRMLDYELAFGLVFTPQNQEPRRKRAGYEEPESRHLR